MKMNIYFYVLVFFFRSVYVLFSFKHNKAWAVRTVVSALALDGNQLFVQKPLWFRFFIWYLLTLPMDHFDLLWDL